MVKITMKIDKSVILDIIILGVFTLYFIFKKNFEFLTYTVTIGLLIALIATTSLKFKYPGLAKYGFSVWLLMHLLGGATHINGIRLYDVILIKMVESPLSILRYDQFVHTFCYFVIALFMLAIVKYYSKEGKKNIFAIGLITVLAAVGIGAINEIIEFSTVVFFNAGAAVGDYYNNALDLVFNLIGALIAVLVSKK